MQEKINWSEKFKNIRLQKIKFTTPDIANMGKYFYKLDPKYNAWMFNGPILEVTPLEIEIRNSLYFTELRELIHSLGWTEDSYNKALSILDKYADEQNAIWDKYVALYPDYKKDIE